MCGALIVAPYPMLCGESAYGKNLENSPRSTASIASATLSLLM